MTKSYFHQARIPSEAGILLDLIREYAPKRYFWCMPWSASYCRSIWGSLINLSEIYHGVATDVQVIKDNTLLFKDLPENFEAGRYHSWAVANENFPEELEITAVDDKGMIMALQHKNTISTLYSFTPKASLHHKVKLFLETF